MIRGTLLVPIDLILSVQILNGASCGGNPRVLLPIVQGKRVYCQSFFTRFAVVPSPSGQERHGQGVEDGCPQAHDRPTDLGEEK